MSTATKSTVEGLDPELTEVMRQAYQYVSDTKGYGFLDLQDVAERFDDVEAITREHVGEFNRQLADGYRCQGCGRHHTVVRINPASNLGDCCDVD